VFNRSPLLDKEWVQKIILFPEPGKQKGTNDGKKGMKRGLLGTKN
jgi:hypothetical protein